MTSWDEPLSSARRKRDDYMPPLPPFWPVGSGGPGADADADPSEPSPHQQAPPPSPKDSLADEWAVLPPVPLAAQPAPQWWSPAATGTPPNTTLQTAARHEATPLTTAPPPHRALIRVLSTAAAMLFVLGVVVGVVGMSGPGSSVADAAFVSTAARATLAERTAHLVISGTLTGNGQTFTISGSGDADFRNNELSLQLQESEPNGQSTSVQELLAGDTIYVNLPEISTQDPGKDWVSLDLSSLQKAASSLGPSMSSGSTDPGAMLQILSQEGATVEPIGTSQYDGVTVTGYSVTFDKAAIERRLSAAGLPSWAKQALSQLSFSGLGMDVYIDSSGDLREMTMNFSVSADGVNLSSSLTLGLSDFGEPVSVTPPPPDQVVPLGQLLQQAMSSMAT